MDLRTTVLIAVVLAAAIPGSAGAAAQDDTSCSFPVSAVDATGTEVTIDEDPDRIVTLGPSAAQTMWEIGAEDEVVGVSKFSSYLEGASEKENVSGGGQQNVVAEKVVALEPDLVLAPNVISNDTVEDQLRDAGLTVFRFGPADSVDFVVEKTRLTGELVGHCEGANETAAWMDDRIGTVREAVDGEERPNVLYSFFGFTVNEGTFIHEMITTAGGENVAANADLQGEYPQLSNEIVANSTVEWLLLNSDAPTVPDNEAYNNTRAVEEDNVLVLEANHISQPAPRIVYPIVKMAEAFHPEAYAAANTTATPTPEATETDTETTETTETAAGITATEAGGTATPEADPTTEAPGQPGFGMVPVLIALVLGLFLTRLR